MKEVAKLIQVSKSFRDGEQRHTVLQAVDLTLHQGETIALTGPSGSGKSTLLNLIAGFESADSGQIVLNHQSTTKWQDKQWSEFRRTHLGVVFQQFNLLTPLNVKNNIGFSLHLNGDSWNPWCDYLVEKLGLAALLNRQVEALSGGQQQRVAIARALAHNPSLLLADEPTGNLDEANGRAIMDLLFELRDRHGATLVMVTHAPELAARCDRVIRLRDGRLEAA